MLTHKSPAFVNAIRTLFSFLYSIFGIVLVVILIHWSLATTVTWKKHLKENQFIISALNYRGT